MKNAICLLVDRLHIGCWGAYGNAEIKTPTLDRLAAESFLADRFYVDTTDTVRQCRSWWCGVHALSQSAVPTIFGQLNAVGCHTVLVTDDPEVAYSPEAGNFSDMQLLPTSDNTEPCNEIDATQLCGQLASIAATAESLARSGIPYCLWCHLRGFDAIWDFPIFLREKYCGEGDPEPYSGTIPPYYRYGTQDIAASVWSSDQIDDFRQSVVSAYMGGMTMFDELLEMLLGPLRDGEWGDETLFLLAGTRGILFGEQGFIGIPPTDGDQVEPLASPLVQVPLALRFPDGFGATIRSDALLQPSDITQWLYEWFELPMPEIFQRMYSAGPAVLDLIRETPQNLCDCLLVVASVDASMPNDTTTCLVTPSWFLQDVDMATNPDSQMDNPFALYIKPDDRWDVNNIADRCDEIVRQLVEVRNDLFRQLVTNDPSPPQPLAGILRERYQ